jgi:hypothetical protein
VEKGSPQFCAISVIFKKVDQSKQLPQSGYPCENSANLVTLSEIRQLGLLRRLKLNMIMKCCFVNF